MTGWVKLQAEGATTQAPKWEDAWCGGGAVSRSAWGHTGVRTGSSAGDIRPSGFMRNKMGSHWKVVSREVAKI